MTALPIATARAHALKLFQAGIDAANPSKAIERSLCVTGGQLEILLNDGKIRPCRKGARFHLIAFGKAACSMAEAVQAIIPPIWLAGKGIAITNYENIRLVDHFDVLGAGHPLPDANGLLAAQRVALHANQAQADDWVLVFISGGGSALIPYPVEGISLQDKIDTTELLLASGADINEINCIRKHLSQIKGGRLAQLIHPAHSHSLILSDVLGDDLSTIASGPTVADNSTYLDAVAILSKKNLWRHLPVGVQIHLQNGLKATITETPKADNPIFNKTDHTLIGGNGLSLKATTKSAKALGYHCQIYSEKLTGIAREQALQLAVTAKTLLDRGLTRPVALLAGGETTVMLTGDGLGGRNQEMALAFAIAANELKLNGDWAFLSGGTDGRDGPTAAAGGLVCTGSLHRMASAGINPQLALDNNDSYTALKSSQDLVITGATGTNVADLQILLLYPHTY